MIIATKFEVDTTIRCQITALLLQIRYVTLRPWPLTFWPRTVIVLGGSRVQSLHWVWRSYAYPSLTYELWLPPQATINNAFRATARMRRIPWPVRVEGKCFLHVWNPWPWFVYLLCNLHSSTIKINWVIPQNSVRPCVKGLAGCSCLRIRQICK